MELIIDIPEEIKVEISRVGLLRISDEKIKAVDKAIQLGKPLPKGHGRLGDLSELEERISNFINYDENIIDKKIVCRERFVLHGIEDTPTIIEADNSEEEETKC